MKTELIIIAIIALLAFGTPVGAAEYSDGDPCSAPGAWHQNNNPDYVSYLICDGANWSDALRFSSSNRLGVWKGIPEVGLDVSGKVYVGFEDTDFESILMRHDANSGGLFTAQREGSDKFVTFSSFEGGGDQVKRLFLGGTDWDVHDTNEIRMYTDPTVPTAAANGGIVRLIVSREGFVGIGNDINPAAELDVIGDIHYTGVIQDVSDKRLKENITALEGSLDGLLSLNGYSFTMKGDDEAVIEYGLMAQEVEAVFPNLVTTQDDGSKTMNYIGLIAPLVEATKAQQALIDTQRDEIDAQQGQINELRSRLQALEQQ